MNHEFAAVSPRTSHGIKQEKPLRCVITVAKPLLLRESNYPDLHPVMLARGVVG